MMRTIWKTALLPLFVLFLHTSCQQRDEFGAWDADNDGRISKEEFVSAYDGYGYYEGWDRNQDGGMDLHEWDTGVAMYYNENYDYPANGYYQDWDLDRDSTLNRDEFTSGSFGVWDSNGDGFIDRSEYDRSSFDRRW